VMKSCVCLTALVIAACLIGACDQPPSDIPAPTEPTEQEEASEPEVKEDPTPGAVVAAGVFTGRSGKPMAGAKMYLGEPVKDDQLAFATVKLVDAVATAVADREGRFQFKGFKPGEYTIVYQPAGTSGLMPQEIPVKALTGEVDSLAPGLNEIELGKNKSFDPRPWGRGYTLLEGHTLWAQGQKMAIRNATAQRRRGGACVEVRRSYLWTQELEDNSEIKFEAWSF